MDYLVLTILALTPCITIGVFFLLKNTYNPQNTKYLFLSVAYGLGSFFLVLGLGHLIHQFFTFKDGNLIYQIIYAIIFIGCLEESSKYLFLRLMVFPKNYFQSAFDGILHSVMVGMGFALAENLIYVYTGEGGSLIIRMVTAIPAHTAFAIIMGYFLGEAKVFPSSRKLFAFMGWFFASFAHGYYDFFLLQKNIPGLWWQSIIALMIALLITYKAVQLREEEEIN